jgi:hypothetical protein
MKPFQKFLAALSLAVLFTAMPSGVRADYHPTRDGGDLGLGLEAGDPGGWGVAGKIWVDRVNAFAPAVKFAADGTAILQLDYLWHNFDIVHLNGPGAMPFYIGVGGDLLMENSVSIAARMPIGLSYIFEKKHVPIDIYFQLVPTVWFYNSGATFDLYPEVGAHYYF